jgi:hypothetical protein
VVGIEMTDRVPVVVGRSVESPVVGEGKDLVGVDIEVLEDRVLVVVENPVEIEERVLVVGMDRVPVVVENLVEMDRVLVVVVGMTDRVPVVVGRSVAVEMKRPVVGEGKDLVLVEVGRVVAVVVVERIPVGAGKNLVEMVVEVVDKGCSVVVVDKGCSVVVVDKDSVEVETILIEVVVVDKDSVEEERIQIEAVVVERNPVGMKRVVVEVNNLILDPVEVVQKEVVDIVVGVGKNLAGMVVVLEVDKGSVVEG